MVFILSFLHRNKIFRGACVLDLGFKNTDTHCIVGSIMNNIVDVWKFGCFLPRS